MKPKDWEKECLTSLQWASSAGLGTGGRYGVSCVPSGTDATGRMLWRPIPSLPDFEGLLANPMQPFIFDCKVCSASSMDLSKLRTERKKQVTHMLERSRFGAVCFFAIYFKERELKTKFAPASAWAFPVHFLHPLWRQFATHAITTITRLACEEYAVPIQFTIPPRCRTPRPDIVSAVRQLASIIREGDWSHGEIGQSISEAATD